MPWAISTRTESLRAFIENPVFLSTVTSWFLAQLIKAVVVTLRVRKRSFREIIEIIIWRTGGMPSSHSAVVSSLATAILFREGPSSNLFIVSLIVAFIVMKDATGVRRSSGLQGRALNNLGKSTAEKLNLEFHPLKEVHGHTPLEVVIGALLGAFIAAAYALL
jgi:acid phosphatase family membrane protein YuiD